jgi:hypothetical protein
MKSLLNRGWKIGVIVWLMVIACNIPMAATQSTTGPGLSPEELAATAVVLTLTARVGEVVPDTPLPPPPDASATLISTAASTFTVTPCVALATAKSVDVNVRSGPGTAYDIVGGIPSGSSARVYGQNDSRTWWYIEFPGGSGRYAWVSGSVTTAACIPDNLQYVAAPPLPTATNTLVVALLPDLYVSEYSWAPVPPHMGVPFHIRVGVYNQGDAAAGAFTVQWWLSSGAPAPACTWHKASLVAHGGYVLQCNYTPGGWNNAYPSLVVVDSGNTVVESNEGNNTTSQPLQVAP